MRPSSTISVSAGTRTSCVIPLTTGMARPARPPEPLGALGHLRAHGGGGVLQRHVGADADRDRQGLPEPLGALEGEAQMPSIIELDRYLVRTDQLQPMI